MTDAVTALAVTGINDPRKQVSVAAWNRLISKVGETVSAEDFGAIGDGATDDRAAIQAALDYVGAAGGGTVLLGPKTYKVVATPRTSNPSNPHLYDGHHLVFNYSNIRLKGHGRNRSKLHFRGYGDVSHATNWQTVSAQVWRGGGIFIKGGATSGAKTASFAVEDLEMYCDGAGNTGNRAWPADVTTGDGWDITHKAIWLENDYYIGDGMILNTSLHAWRGEIIYSGGYFVDRLTIHGNLIYDTNGDGVSVGSALDCRYNEIYNCFTSAFENGIGAALSQEICDNYVHGCPYIFLSLSVAVGSTAYVKVEGNVFEDCGRAFLGSLARFTISRNKFIDCESASAAGLLVFTTAAGNTASCTDGVIADNEFICDDTTVTASGIFALAGGAESRLAFRRNRAWRTAAAIAAGRSILGSVYAPTITTPYRVTWDSNEFDTTFSGTLSAKTLEKQLTTTGATTVISHRPFWPGVHAVDIMVRVITAATTLTLTVEWYDGSSALNTMTFESAVSKAVGVYPYRIIVPAYSASESEKVFVKATAATANQVFITATIQRADQMASA